MEVRDPPSPSQSVNRASHHAKRVPLRASLDGTFFSTSLSYVAPTTTSTLSNPLPYTCSRGRTVCLNTPNIGPYLQSSRQHRCTSFRRSRRPEQDDNGRSCATKAHSVRSESLLNHHTRGRCAKHSWVPAGAAQIRSLNARAIRDSWENLPARRPECALTTPEKKE